MDVEGLIQGLVGVARQPLSRLQSRQASARAAVTSLSEVGTLLADLEKAAGALDTEAKVGSFKATSANEDSLTITAAGGAQAGSYDVRVAQLARAERRYSQAFDSANGALGQNGTLTLQIGTGDLQDPEGNILVGAATAAIEINPEDTLGSIIGKINDSGLRVQASSFFDGEQYRIQLRGLDVGADNKLTVDQNGLTLGLNEQANIVHSAQNALVEIDGIEVTSATNKITSAISGVTLNLLKETSDSFQVSIENDSSAMGDKLDAFVKAYNGVIDKVHTLAGFGEKAGTNPFLTGDATLRGITNQLSRKLTATFGGDRFNTLASLGVQLNNNGTLKLDRTKLDDALATDPNAVPRVLAGGDDADGIMDLIRDIAKSLNAPDTGILSVRKDGLDSRASSLGDQLTREEDRLTRLEERLRKTFTEMDGTVAAYNSQLSYLTR